MAVSPEACKAVEGTKGKALKKFMGAGNADDGRPGISIDELQGLLLQVSFALMMVFMIAYFMFKTVATQTQDEQLLELQKQKLVAAVEGVGREYETRYGLSTLLKMGDDGKTEYDATAYIDNGRLTSTPILREAFSEGAANAASDYADMLALRRIWWDQVLEKAGLNDAELKHENRVWLGTSIDSAMDGLGNSVEGVQLLSASLLQRHWMDHPDQIGDAAVEKLLVEFKEADESRRLLLATDLANALRRNALAYLGREAGAKMLAE